MPKKATESDRSHRFVLRGATAHAPQLMSLVNALFTLRRDPRNMRAKRIVARDGAGLCPACHAPLDLAGYRKTTTHYSERETLHCAGCATTLLLRERHIV